MSTRNEEGLNEIKIDDEEAEKGPVSKGSSRKEESEEQQESDDSGSGGSKVTVQMDSEVANRLRSAVYLTPGLTMWEVVQKGTETILERLEERRGEKFPSDFDKKLEGGRPPKDTPKPEL